MGLDSVELIIRFEESLGITIPNASAEQLQTPADVIDFAMSELQRLGHTPMRYHVAEIVRLVTVDSVGINPKQYRESARFIEDFGID
jgi:hypothetical protein